MISHELHYDLEHSFVEQGLNSFLITNQCFV